MQAVCALSGATFLLIGQLLGHGPIYAQSQGEGLVGVPSSEQQLVSQEEETGKNKSSPFKPRLARFVAPAPDGRLGAGNALERVPPPPGLQSGNWTYSGSGRCISLGPACIRNGWKLRS
jgi:hypothetical protein